MPARVPGVVKNGMAKAASNVVKKQPLKKALGQRMAACKQGWLCLVCYVMGKERLKPAKVGSDAVD